MRRRAWAALAAFAAAILLGLLGRALEATAVLALTGMALVASAALALSLLPWPRLLPEIPPMPGLFPQVPSGGRWCDRCGAASPPGPCRRCGAEGRGGKG